MTRGLLAVLVVAGLAAAAPAQADATFPLHRCSSQWMSRAGAAWGTSESSWRRTPGPAANFMVSLRPTARARSAGVWRPVWNALRTCVRFPSDLSRARRDSLYKQLVCHQHWSLGALQLGGQTWDLEAWRPDVSLAAVLSFDQVLDPNKRCNWGMDTGPPMA